MRIGIDVGGTHTDAVLLNGDRIETTIKALTTANVTDGVINALRRILDDSGLAPAAISAVMIGTTQFTNAVVERRKLSRVAAIRIGLPSGRGLPPMTDWPEDLAAALGREHYMIAGGYLYDGWPLAPLDEYEIDAVINSLKQSGTREIAIASAFAPMNADPEIQLAEALQAALPEARISMSHQFGRLGLLERENATLLNAALLDFASEVVAAFATAIVELKLDCPVFISQNDGTLMNADFVRRFPALTFASGPTNSLRGAAKLSGLSEAIVVDIGGTTSDIGVLQNGFPRESNAVIEVGGVRTNFRMPDILAVGLGGGSLVSADGETLGPQSVGHRLVSEGRVFGGTVLTATDIAVASGVEGVGDPQQIADLPETVRIAARKEIKRLLDTNIDRMKPSADPLPVILVGGGAVLVTEALDTAARLLRPENAGVANAIGAAIAQIGGEAERLVNYRETPRETAIAQITREASENAIAAGADADSLRVADTEEIAIPYMDEGAMRVRIKVIGDIAVLAQAEGGAA